MTDTAKDDLRERLDALIGKPTDGVGKPVHAPECPCDCDVA